MKISLSLNQLEEKKELEKFTLSARYLTIVDDDFRNFTVKTMLVKNDAAITDENVGCCEVHIIDLYGTKHIGRIEDIYKDKIEIKIYTKKRRGEVPEPPISPNQRYQIKFVPNRYSSNTAFRAIDSAINKNMSDFLETFEGNTSVFRGKDLDEYDFTWYNSTIKDNDEQKNAVVNIVNCSSFPSPYIIVGPPGNNVIVYFYYCFQRKVLICQVLVKRQQSSKRSFKSCIILQNLISWSQLMQILHVMTSPFVC
jgi:hypothetical protein